MMRGWLLVAVLVGVLATPAASAAMHEVRIRGNPTNFQPSEISINQGDTVRWISEAGTHTATSDADGQSTWQPDGRFDGDITTAQPYEFTFDNAGTYHYYCQPHSSFMHGKVMVAAVHTDSFPPTTSPTMVTITDSFPTTEDATTGTGTDEGDDGAAPRHADTPFAPAAFVVLAMLLVALLHKR